METPTPPWSVHPRLRTEPSDDAPAAEADSTLLALRAELGELDRLLLETVNGRVALVRTIWDYKARRCLRPVDQGREVELIEQLQRANRGPLTCEEVAQLFEFVLSLTKQSLSFGTY